ncbi:helix-turn-helix domain-containing protein [Alkaliflexus imshenetskii]|uniref:helix-turn-helix domain-containing protein n=1 Tax=Alkaliflexus imshenetskii TaxID=286730 RepID=UPI00047894CA|nr:helix-turn-helix domain-containing protein [Alkaliflexus imshenetskii]
MSGLTNNQKKEWAQQLYTRENLTQKEIAERVGVSAVTINKWVKKERWEEMKVSITLTKEEQLKNLYRQIAELNKSILEREDGKRFATPSEADSIGKLANAIEKMETDVGVSDLVESFRVFTNWLRTFNLEMAKTLVPLMDSFIKTRIR